MTTPPPDPQAHRTFDADRSPATTSIESSMQWGVTDLVDGVVAALTPEVWARVNRELTAKVFTEFWFEELLVPVSASGLVLRDEHPDGTTDAFSIDLPPASRFAFTATRRHLGHWRVDPASLTFEADGAAADLPDVPDLVALAGPAIGMSADTLGGAIGELSNTLLSDARQMANGRPAAELVDLDPLLLEGEMRAHPWIVANKGRIGFGAGDLARYAPESQQAVPLRWLAADSGTADVRTVTGLAHHDVVREQVGDDHYAVLQERAADAGLDPDECAYLPVHPWQWEHRVIPLHAAELARRQLVDLGLGPGRYLPQQSIRTLADADDPDRRYLKLPISILNTSVYRGLPRARALAAPALTEWFLGVTGADPFLAETGLELLGEVASVSVAHRAFEAVDGVAYQHTEMLGAIWRDSVGPRLQPGERAITLAALMHSDPAGRSFAAELIARSGLSVDEWVARLHEVTLPPLVHVLYRYGATFSPHGQNCLLVLRDHVPVRLVVKDFVDDANISGEALPELATLPAEARAALDGGLDGLILVQWIQGGLLVCVHRYVGEILDADLGYPEARFWARAAEALHRYQDRFDDELAERFLLFDLEAPAFVKLCLNRVRVLERGYADDAERPIAAAAGFIDNPLAYVDDPIDDPIEESVL